jgi:regulatory protein
VRKGCPGPTAERIVDSLLSERLVSDDRFVESYVSARRNRGYGPVSIRQELRRREVPETVIDRWLDTGNQSWLQDLSQVRQKKFGSKLPGNFTERARQMRFLQYRGFTTEQIQQVMSPADPD